MIVLFRAIFWEEIISAAIVKSMLMLNDLGSYLKEITELVQKVLFFFCRVKRWVFLNDKHEHSLKTICDRFWIYTIITCPAIMWPRHTAPLSPTFSSLRKKVEWLCCWKYVFWYWTFKWTFFSGLFEEQSERVWSECNLKSGWIAEFVRSQAKLCQQVFDKVIRNGRIRHSTWHHLIHWE